MVIGQRTSSGTVGRVTGTLTWHSSEFQLLLPVSCNLTCVRCLQAAEAQPGVLPFGWTVDVFMCSVADRSRVSIVFCIPDLRVECNNFSRCFLLPCVGVFRIALPRFQGDTEWSNPCGSRPTFCGIVLDIY